MAAHRLRRAAGALLIVLIMALMPAAQPAIAASRIQEELGRPVAARQRLAVGGFHSCVVMPDSTARCWGANTTGQLGDGTTTPSSTPIVVGSTTPLTGIVSISAQDDDQPASYTCAVIIGGTARCWGQGYGVEPSIIGGTTPLTGIVTLAAGEKHACAVVIDSTVRCWGVNAGGQLGDGSTTDSSTPVIVGSTTPLTGVSSITAGEQHTCAVMINSTARCWGVRYATLPTVIGGNTPLTGIIALSGTCAILVDSTARCWDSGAITPITSENGTPLTGIIAINTGRNHSCAVLANGTARCWGNNESGQLGDGTIADSSAPVIVGGGTLLNGIATIDVGYDFTCALLVDHSVHCWGNNPFGQLGTDAFTKSKLPVRVQGLEIQRHRAVGLSVGARHTCVKMADGTGRCWGNNVSGALGDGTRSSSSVPVVIGGTIPLTNIVTINNGSPLQYNTPVCAAVADGTARCWGPIQMGDDAVLDASNLRIVGGSTPMTSVVSITSGTEHACALIVDGTAYCWGQNNYGQILGGYRNYHYTPVIVRETTPLTNIIAISAGYRATCTLMVQGTLRCWGDFINKEVNTYIDNTAVATNQRHPCALSINSIVQCAFRNRDAYESHIVTKSKIVITDGSNAFTGVLAISGRDAGKCVVAIDGTARCWRGSDMSQIDDGAPPFTNIVEISVSSFHTCALTSDGRVYCWGDNFHGQLGNGTTTDSLTPVEVDLNGTPLIHINSSAVVEEAETAVVSVTVHLSSPATTTVAVTYATADGSAIGDADFEATSGTLLFEPGTTTQTLSVPIKNDNRYEPAETFSLVLSAAEGAPLATSHAAITIIDDDEDAPLYTSYLPLTW